MNFYKEVYYESLNTFRTNADFVDIVENVRSKELASRYPELEVIEIPDDIEFYIDSNDESGGYETIHETHRIW
jgi:hypothetical protein